MARIICSDTPITIVDKRVAQKLLYIYCIPCHTSILPAATDRWVDYFNLARKKKKWLPLGILQPNFFFYINGDMEIIVQYFVFFVHVCNRIVNLLN